MVHQTICNVVVGERKEKFFQVEYNLAAWSLGLRVGVL